MSSLSEYFVLIAGISKLLVYWPYILFAAGVVILLFLIFLFVRRMKKTKTTPKPTKLSATEGDSAQPLLKMVNQLNGSSRSVLLAANRIGDLPVTIPIKLAISLAENGKCLVIDFDAKRNAMAKVFDVDFQGIDPILKARPVPTSVNNLEIWPARYFDRLKQTNLHLLLDRASKKYDHIILYAPYLPTLPDRNQIAYCSKQAILFSHKSKDEKESILHQLLKEGNCRILGEV